MSGFFFGAGGGGAEGADGLLVLPPDFIAQGQGPGYLPAAIRNGDGDGDPDAGRPLRYDGELGHQDGLVASNGVLHAAALEFHPHPDPAPGACSL